MHSNDKYYGYYHVGRWLSATLRFPMTVTYQRRWMTRFEKSGRMLDGCSNIMRMSTTDMPIDVLDLMHQFHLVLTQFLAQSLQRDQFVFAFLVELLAPLRFHRFTVSQLIFQWLIVGFDFASIIQYGIRFTEYIYFCEILIENSTNYNVECRITITHLNHLQSNSLNWFVWIEFSISSKVLLETILHTVLKLRLKTDDIKR